MAKNKTRELIKLSKYDKTGKLGDRTYYETLHGTETGSASPLMVGAVYLAGKAGLLDKKKKQEYTNIDGMKIAIRKDHRGKKAKYKD
jgi:hypothetical protein|tara:strand:+ start:952 stop:1212 length:261 start_codon:yes stop_codon:yes gene_type:complete